MRKRERDLKFEDDTLWALKMKEEATSQGMQRNADRFKNLKREGKQVLL